MTKPTILYSKKVRIQTTKFRVRNRRVYFLHWLFIFSFRPSSFGKKKDFIEPTFRSGQLAQLHNTSQRLRVGNIRESLLPKYK